MEDDRAGRRAADGERRYRPDRAATAVAAPESRGGGQEPPDVIDVVFPVPGAEDTGRAAAAGPRGGPARRERLRERPLLLGAVSIAAVAVAAVVAWQVWPQSPGATAPDRPAPPPSSTRPLTSGGISGHAAGPLPSAGGHTGRAPAADGDPTRRATPPAGPSAMPGSGAETGTGHGNGSPAPGSSVTGAPPTTAPSDSPAPSATAPTPRTLQAGDTGSDVTDLQRLLFAQGITYVSPTGVYDDATVRGVTQIQRDRGITCDPTGVYGPCTRAALAP
ncbi:peptidoglycan-binding protein [Streptomyces sp. NPDC008079]|uniref:peptidoglycan-binding domain-containing protein n=1 Tax=Streptomyces sp. NPDC008079 TaxID=3364806 RepID=UPI0036E94A40